LLEALMSARLDFIRHVREAEIVRCRAFDRLVLEGADAVELGFVEPVEKEAEVLLRLAGKADDEGRADGELRADPPPGANALKRLFLTCRPPHRLQDCG